MNNKQSSTKEKLIFSIILGAWAAIPMAMAAYYSGDDIPLVSRINDLFTKALISLCANAICNMTLNVSEVFQNLHTEKSKEWYHIVMASIGAMPKVAINYQEQQNNIVMLIGITFPALAVYTFLGLQAQNRARNIISAWERIAGCAIAFIACTGLYSYCALAGEALLFNAASKPWWAILSATAIPSVFFLFTVSMGCFGVTKEILSNWNNAKESFQSAKGPAKKTWIVMKEVLFFAVIAAVTAISAGPALRANRRYPVPYLPVAFVDACTISVITLFNSLGFYGMRKYDFHKAFDQIKGCFFSEKNPNETKLLQVIIPDPNRIDTSLLGNQPRM